MRRGLKLTTYPFDGQKQIGSWNDFPDEKGIETLAKVRRAAMKIAVGTTSPMRRGLKRPCFHIPLRPERYRWNDFPDEQAIETMLAGHRAMRCSARWNDFPDEQAIETSKSQDSKNQRSRQKGLPNEETSEDYGSGR